MDNKTRFHIDQKNNMLKFHFTNGNRILYTIPNSELCPFGIVSTWDCVLRDCVFRVCVHSGNCPDTHYINGNQINKAFCKKYSNKLTKIKALSKKLFNATKLQESQNDLRGMWKIIHSALRTCSDCHVKNNTALNINGKKLLVVN